MDARWRYYRPPLRKCNNPEKVIFDGRVKITTNKTSYDCLLRMKEDLFFNISMEVLGAVCSSPPTLAYQFLSSCDRYNANVDIKFSVHNAFLD